MRTNYPLCIWICPQCYELPTAKEIADIIFNDEIGKEKFKRAYYESFTFRERGGWIFANPDDPTQLEVLLAPISASGTFLATDMTTTPSIDLNDIPTNGVPPGQRGGMILKPRDSTRGNSDISITMCYY